MKYSGAYFKHVTTVLEANILRSVAEDDNLSQSSSTSVSDPCLLLCVSRHGVT